MRADTAISSGARDTAITFFTRLAVMVATLGVQSALAWLLGPEGRGEYAVCILFAMILSTVFALSVDRAGQYLVASGRASVNEGVVATLSVGLAGSALGMLAGLLLLNVDAEFFHKASAQSFRLSLFLVPTNVLSNSLTLLLMGMRRFAWMSRISVLRVLTHLGLTLALVWGLNMGVQGALIALMVGNLVSIVDGIRLTSLESASWRARPTREHCATLIWYGARYWIANLSNQVHFRVGTIVLAWFVATSQIGLFAAASGLVARVLVIPDALDGALLYRVAADPTGRPDLVARTARMSAIVCAVLLAMLVLLGRPLVAVLFSPSFLPAVPLIWIIAIGIFLRSGSKVLMPYFMGVDHPAVCSWAVGLATLANVGALLVLLPSKGLVGAAWAMTIGYAVSTSVLVTAFRRSSRLGLVETWLPRLNDLRQLSDVLRQSSRGFRAPSGLGKA